MTLNQLQSYVANLCYDTEMDDADLHLLIVACRLAMDYIDRLSPKLAKKTITHGDEQADYDFSTLVSDFGRFWCDPVYFGSDCLIEGDGYAFFGDEIITLPADAEGTYTVVYCKALTYPSEYDTTAEIDVKKAYETALILLCAYYYWMDDEPAKASQFKQRADEEITSIIAKSQVSDSEAVKK